jgi:CRP/FNR family transcriptional regulator, cyclic AMP receptor protein
LIKKKEEVDETRHTNLHKNRKKNRTRTDGRACRASSFPGWDEPDATSTTDRLCDPGAFQKGQVVLQEGEFANRFYLIESGKVVLESGVEFGEPVVIEEIGPGDLLGWSWMFPPHVWHFTARAIEPTEAIFFYGTILREYCERNHSLGYDLFKRMSPIMLRRLQAAREKMLSLHARQASLKPVA